MLYWGEGAKCRNSLAFVNSDVDMLRFFLRFLRLVDVPDGRINLSVTVHLGNGLTLAEIEAWWLEQLEFPRSCLRKSVYGAIQEYAGIERPEWVA